MQDGARTQGSSALGKQGQVGCVLERRGCRLVPEAALARGQLAVGPRGGWNGGVPYPLCCPLPETGPVRLPPQRVIRSREQEGLQLVDQGMEAWRWWDTGKLT